MRLSGSLPLYLRQFQRFSLPASFIPQSQVQFNSTRKREHSSSPSTMPAGIFNSSYYGKDYRAGAALLRARRPYLVKNAVTGLALVGFTIGIYAYTLRAVGQEEFSDVKVPDTPADSKQQ